MESPEFSEVKTQQTVLKEPALDAIRRYPREILTSALIRMSEQAPFYLFITFVLTYGTDKLNMAKGELLNYTMIAAALGLISVPFFGHLSDRFGRRLIYGIGIVCTGLYAFPYFGLLNTRSSGLVLLAIVISMVSRDCDAVRSSALRPGSSDTFRHADGTAQVAGDHSPGRSSGRSHHVQGQHPGLYAHR